VVSSTSIELVILEILDKKKRKQKKEKKKNRVRYREEKRYEGKKRERVVYIITAGQ